MAKKSNDEVIPVDNDTAIANDPIDEVVDAPIGDIAEVSKPIAKKKKAEEDPKPKPIIVPKEIDPTQYVVVRNGFQGILVYKSPRTGEIFKWEGFGAEQEMELRELRNAKSSAKSFFINNWFMFDEEWNWVIDYLGVRQYYKNAIPVDRFDEFFKLPPDEMEDAISKLSRGQKRSLAYRAHELMNSKSKVIDSISTVRLLEKTLGINLTED